jgi:hypothetical protein
MVRPTWPVAGSTNYLSETAAVIDDLQESADVQESGVYNVLHYGAVGDGVALSTDELQATIDAAVTSEVATGVITLPAGTFDIDDVLTVSYRHGTVIQGAGPGLTTIRQRTDNTAIFRFITDPFAHHITIRDLTLTWTNQQENTDTGAIAIDLWGDANAQPYFVTLENVKIAKAHYGIKASNSTDHTIPFLTTVRSVLFTDMAGSAISIMSTGGKPDWMIERVYISPGTGAAKPTGRALEFTGCDLITRGITVDSWPQEMFYSEGATVPIIFDGLHIEGGTLDDPNGVMKLIHVANSGFIARKVNYQQTINAAGEYYWLFWGEGNAGAVCSIDGLVSTSTITTGNLYPLGLESGAIGRVSAIVGTWTENPGLMAFGTTTDGIYQVDDHLYVPTKAGTPTDSDVPIARDGAMVVDTTNDLLYVRSGGAWVSTALT